MLKNCHRTHNSDVFILEIPFAIDKYATKAKRFYLINRFNDCLNAIYDLFISCLQFKWHKAIDMKFRNANAVAELTIKANSNASAKKNNH